MVLLGLLRCHFCIAAVAPPPPPALVVGDSSNSDPVLVVVVLPGKVSMPLLGGLSTAVAPAPAPTAVPATVVGLRAALSPEWDTLGADDSNTRPFSSLLSSRPFGCFLVAAFLLLDETVEERGDFLEDLPTPVLLVPVPVPVPGLLTPTPCTFIFGEEDDLSFVLLPPPLLIICKLSSTIMDTVEFPLKAADVPSTSPPPPSLLVLLALLRLLVMATRLP
mmetsp:Transcript_25017/g.41832  ORF Transcript_25017/g.41832 Transcript_25017/m.41832 type:complete len:220 (-) Transcript_25017:39-698(-)